MTIILLTERSLQKMTNELTVRVEHPELPAIRWNEDEVRQNLTEMLAAYTGRVYTPETIKDAKADRAAVNKLDKQLADAARGAKTFYMKPLEEFLQSAKQMQAQCKQVSGAIDAQVKAGGNRAAGQGRRPAGHLCGLHR
mgnify:CR=1 FL=1